MFTEREAEKKEGDENVKGYCVSRPARAWTSMYGRYGAGKLEMGRNDGWDDKEKSGIKCHVFRQ